MRNPPKVPARINGTNTIANTFQRTGQFFSDQLEGRFGAVGARSSSSVTNPSKSSCCVNDVIAARPRYRLRVRLFLMERLSYCFLINLPSCGLALYAWQLIEYASSARVFPQFLLNRQSSRGPS